MVAVNRRFDPDETCYFCGREVPHELAIEEGWTPCFWLDETTSADAPACPDCASEHLTDFDNDPILKPDHPRPE
jgi:hypothetical protein